MHRYRDDKLEIMRETRIEHSALNLSEAEEVEINLDVACINLAFETTRLIKLLRNRGEVISTGKDAKTIESQNKIIDKYLRKGGIEEI